MNTRVVNLQSNIVKMSIEIAENFENDGGLVRQSLKLRDYEGRSTMTMLLETKVYSFLQVKSIEESIKTLWLGKVNFGGKFM